MDAITGIAYKISLFQHSSETFIVLRKNETNKNVFNTPSVKEHAAFKGEL